MIPALKVLISEAPESDHSNQKKIKTEQDLFDQSIFLFLDLNSEKIC